MKNTILLFGLFFVHFSGFSQDMGTDRPVSWDPEINTNPPVFILDSIDMAPIIKADSINDLDKNQPWRYGITRDLNLNISDGLWTDLPNGGRIWQLVIHSPGALNLSINFSKIEIPQGARLQLFNSDHTDLTGSYTGLQSFSKDQLGTWFVEGETIWLEYYEPRGVSESPVLHLEHLIHGYRLGRLNEVLSERGINDSGACHYDVNCSVGADFDSHKDLLKKAVALLNLGNGHLCTATLINNAENDKTPFLLTANHCLEGSNPAMWSVRFNWISPNPVCGTGDESTNTGTNFTMSGAVFRASNTLSDFALVELSNPIPSTWDVAFAGWDNSDTDPAFAVGIHHPNGDIMKVCRDDTGPQKEEASSVRSWLIGGGEHGYGNGWEIGTTESGSSGSPLFNEEGKIIGQLFAGQAGCDGIQSNHDYDLYGRFAVSWTGGETADSRLKDWLDPKNTGVTKIESMQNILSVPDFELTGELKIYPNPTSNILNIYNNKYPNLSFEIYNLIGQKLKAGDISNTLSSISFRDFSEGIYLLRLIDGETQDSMSKKIIVKR